jgi:small GTP-binding protein
MAGDFKFKLVMIGDFAVGKTSLVKRYVYDIFDDTYLTTIGVKVLRKDITASLDGGEQPVSFLIWDIGGEERFNSVSQQYLKGASAALIVADMTRQNTIDNIANHYDMFRQHNPGSIAAIALNKIDLISRNGHETDTIDTIRRTCGNNGIVDILATSAKHGTNVDAMFGIVAEKLLSSRRQ